MNRLFQLLFIFLIGISITACVDQTFDEPPIDGEDPGITANATIADLKGLYKAGQLVPITEELIIGGVVVADDRSGNYFRSFILQDGTAGIEVRINQTSAYNFYPIGRQLFIKCKGLVLGDYNGVAQLGGYIYVEDGAQQLGDIVALNEHIIKGKRVGAPAPKVKKINELTTADISTLIKLENVEFAGTDVGLPFADVIGRASLNRTVTDCNGNKILLRTSGYATFAGETIPEGNGSIVAIYSVFGRDKQLFIRELNDVTLEGPRCTAGGGGSGSTGNETAVGIQEIRNLFKGGTKTGPADKKIVGVVISDRTNGNWDGRNLVIQDATGGIAVRFTGNHTFNVGDAVDIVISGQELSEFNGLLQVNNVDNNLAKKTGAGTLPTPREATTAEIKNNLENWESTLVKVKGATLSGGSNYSGNRKVNDASGNIDLFTRSQASFASQALPAGTVDVIAVVSQFNNPQLIIRNTSDVITAGGGNPGGNGNPVTSLEESFNGVTNNQDLALQGWKNIAIKGTRLWRGGIFQGNGYAQATAFQDTNNEMETWLITPQIDLNEAKTLTFESAQAFFTHNGLSVLISSNFDGTNVAGATWTPLNATLAGTSNANYDWVPSGDVDLSAYSGKIYIGFKYVGDKTSKTTTYRIDNVKIRKK